MARNAENLRVNGRRTFHQLFEIEFDTASCLCMHNISRMPCIVLILHQSKSQQYTITHVCAYVRTTHVPVIMDSYLLAIHDDI